ncbi:hypothetical protein MKK55_18680 [Methylobacterium sp. J-059]|uniref:hypothetical protein n=1 Tax=Methylobacterium sp. J-059 TaxID=2836643 RepID=UPI001FB9D2AC|nr:hypothetical protein [Methylobacterium sp. J-059]MCJ2040957.1 hypothetical protein [Methylobacterium sp. J-059]
MGQVWHVPEGCGPDGIAPGFYAEDEEALTALLADPTTEHASVPVGAPSPLVHGQRARVATPEQAEVLRAYESKARLYLGMTADQIARHEDWVRRYKAERAVEDANAIAVDAKRKVDLGAMDDIQVVNEALSQAAPGAWDYEAATALQVLRDAGFVRADLRRLRSAHVTLEEVLRRIVGQIPKLADPPDQTFIAVSDRLIMDAAVNLSMVEEAA